MSSWSSATLASADLDRYLPPESELSEQFVLAGGPGGQHVNRTETAVQLRFDAQNSNFLDDATRKRLLRLAGRRTDQHGVITIVAREMRSQVRNREAARQRLAELIERASRPPRPRIPTAPSRNQRRKRMDSKRRRGQRKQLRKPPGGDH